MINILKKLLFAAALSTLLLACESDSPNPDVPLVRLVSIELAGENWKTFSYDDNGVLTSYKSYYSAEDYYEFKYFLNDNGRIDSVQKWLNGVDLNATIIYAYVNDTKIEKLEYYGANQALYNTATYTYTGDQLTNIDNSDKSVNGLHFRNFEYSAENNVSKVSFDFGNPYNYIYHTDKQIQTPLSFDISDPTNTIKHLISEFTFVPYSSYTATYEFDSDGLVTTETRTYAGRPVDDPDYPQEEEYTYSYQNF
jgi:hypothetical protein